MKVGILVGTLVLVLFAGIGIEGAFAQSADPSMTGDAVASASSGSSSIVTLQNTQRVCTLIDFEGIGNLQPVGTIGDASFAKVNGLIDFDVGGSGNTANEPSPETVLQPDFNSPISRVSLANPADEITVFYSSPNGPSEMRLFDAANNLLATIPLPQTPPGPGDPTGGQFGTWVQKTHNEASFVIQKVEFGGNFFADRTLYDDFVFCTENGVNGDGNGPVGGEIIPIETTSLLLAGAQANAAWMIPVVLSVLGIGLFVVSRKSE